MWIRSVSAALLLTTLHSSTFAVKFTTVMSIKSSVCCSTPSFFSLGDVLLVKSPLSVSISPILVEICRRGHHFHWSTPTWKIEQLENRIVSFPPPQKKTPRNTQNPECHLSSAGHFPRSFIFQSFPRPIAHRPSPLPPCHHVNSTAFSPSAPRFVASAPRSSSRRQTSTSPWRTASNNGVVSWCNQGGKVQARGTLVLMIISWNITNLGVQLKLLS